MNEMMVAVATDDGQHFIDRHFGDARFFDVYRMTATDFRFIERIENCIEDCENVHADEEKAKGVGRLLIEARVRVVVSRIFGPNIERIKKKFVCVIMNDKSIGEALARLCQNWEKIETEWNKGEARNHCILRECK